MKYVDNFLNSITMYRLVLYYLIILLVFGGIASILHLLPYSVTALAFTTAFFVFTSAVGNFIFVKVFKAAANVESVYISALILALIFSPIKTLDDLPGLLWVAAWVVGSKFIFNLNRKHVFNPVAIAAVITGVAIGVSPTWWVGSSVMLPLVVVGGLLIVRKIRRSDMVTVFMCMALATMIVLGLFKGTDPITMVRKALLDSPILFFAFIMITEPLTTPPTKMLQAVYGAIVGFFFAPQLQFAGFFTTPELALVIGNVFSFLVSPPYKLLLTLQQKVKLSDDQYDFIFMSDRQFDFRPGQYLEWTVGHHSPDDRGNRRYFTIASSPTEAEVRMGVKFYEPASSYKRALQQLEPGQAIMAGQLAGDFTLRPDASQKMVFIAGGIGVTPFRSMIKYLIDTNQQRDMVLMYANKTASEIVYKDVFDEAEQKLGLRTIYILSDKDAVPPGWQGQVGHITPEMIQQQIPDFKERMYYVSGSHGMVTMFEETLQQIGVPKKQIITDFFPGFA